MGTWRGMMGIFRYREKWNCQAVEAWGNKDHADLTSLVLETKTDKGKNRNHGGRPRTMSWLGT